MPQNAAGWRIDVLPHLAMDFIGHGDEFSNNGTAHVASSRIIAAAFSPIMMAGALVLPEMISGMIDELEAMEG